jgi:hypothetical protein
MKIPEKISRFKAYVGTVEEANNLVGVTSEVTLPSFEAMSETLSLAGMAGEIDSPATGQFQSSDMEIPFSNIDERGMKLAQDDSKPLILAAGQEVTDSGTYKKTLIKRTITVKGMTKSINLGKLKKAGYGEPSIKKEVVYYKDEIEQDGKKTTLIELDKLNGIYKVNGTDMYAGLDL